MGTLVFSGLKANDFDLVGPNSEILYSIVDDGQNSVTDTFLLVLFSNVKIKQFRIYYPYLTLGMVILL